MGVLCYSYLQESIVHQAVCSALRSPAWPLSTSPMVSLTAYYISNGIVIMQRGQVVEMGPAQAILEVPEHPYARPLKKPVLSTDDAGHGKVQPRDRSLAQAAAEQSGSGMLVEGSGGGRYALRSRWRSAWAARGRYPLPLKA